MSLLLQLTLRGSLVLLLVLALEWTFGRRMRSLGRRLWWCTVPLGFLVPWRIPVPLFRPDFSDGATSGYPFDNAYLILPLQRIGRPATDFVPIMIWAGGAVAYLLVVLVQTWRASRSWSDQRLCTDGELLEILEDAKTAAGVTAPIGLVVTELVSAPAILGWLRPRILLPTRMAESMPSGQLRAILLHELAHFHAADIPLNWLFSLAGAVQWFNPLAYWAGARWHRFQEEAADESALDALPAQERGEYGPALLEAIRQTAVGRAPRGALAMTESMQDLKRRLTLIKQSGRKAPRLLFSTLVALCLATLVVADPAPASGSGDTLEATVSGMTTWLQEIDSGAYAQSWREASANFQRAANQDIWVGQLKAIRTPLGACTKRTMLSANRLENVKRADGSVLPGPFVIARFSTSFTNMLGAIETVSFEREADGSWKAGGYFIKPATQ